MCVGYNKFSYTRNKTDTVFDIKKYKFTYARNYRCMLDDAKCGLKFVDLRW